MIEHACAIVLVITMIVNEFIITIGFGGRGTRSIRGRVLFCSRGFEILCILLVLNSAWASQLIIFMIACSQY